MSTNHTLLSTTALACAVAFAPAAFAQEAEWESFDVYNFDSGEAVEETIAPTASASEKWSLCAVVPHMKDGYWISVDYGLVAEAKRLGVELTILQAGGYDQLSRQVSQFDDCIASGADAVLIAPISEAGLADKIAATAATDVVQIGFVNPVLGLHGGFIVGDIILQCDDIGVRPTFGCARGGETFKFQADIGDLAVPIRGDDGNADIAGRALFKRALQKQAFHRVSDWCGAGFKSIGEVSNGQLFTGLERTADNRVCDLFVGDVSQRCLANG